MNQLFEDCNEREGKIVRFFFRTSRYDSLVAKVTRDMNALMALPSDDIKTQKVRGKQVNERY